VRMSGFVIWLVWAAIHLMYLAASSIRASVLVQWLWTFLTAQRGSGLIVKHHADAGATVSPRAPAAAPAPRAAVAG